MGMPAALFDIDSSSAVVPKRAKTGLLRQPAETEFSHIF
jgi:hypothetical protein